MSGIEADPAATSAPASVSAPRPLTPARVWLLTLAAGLISGPASWLIGEAIHYRFAPPTLVVTASSSGGFLSGPEVFRRDMAKRGAQLFEAGLTFASLGAILGLALGLAGGAVRGPGSSGWIAPSVGAMLGGASGAAASLLILPVYYRLFDPDTNELIVGLATQMVIASCVGSAGGVAFGIGRGERGFAIRALVGGLLGAVAGVLVYQMAGAIAFPLDGTSTPIPVTTSARLFARLAVTILASAGVAMGVLNQVK
jgi:hypothetical protein